MKVAVVDQNRKPLAPCSPRRARRLLSTGQAAVLKRFPFTLILRREVVQPTLPDLRLKLDPGSKVTGIAIVNQASGEVVFAAELTHRGQAIKAALDSRRVLRRGRRTRKTRYRKARFLNRTRPLGWLAPSLTSRISNVATWAKRLSSVYPVAGVAMELVRFDTQLMQDPEISGVQYQQGELAGVDLATKYAEIVCCSYGAEEVPTVFLDSEDTHNAKHSRWTGVSFKDYVGWDVFAAEVSRYTLRVTLTKSKEA